MRRVDSALGRLRNREAVLPSAGGVDHETLTERDRKVIGFPNTWVTNTHV